MDRSAIDTGSIFTRPQIAVRTGLSLNFKASLNGSDIDQAIQIDYIISTNCNIPLDI